MAGEGWAGLGNALASLIFLAAMLKQYIPFQLQDFAATYAQKLLAFLNPYVHITIFEYAGEHIRCSEAFSAVEAYLSAAECSGLARRLKAEAGAHTRRVVLSMDDHEEVVDTFQGARLWWLASRNLPRSTTISWYPGEEERRFYRLTFHRRFRDLVVGGYLPHVIEEGRAVTIRNRRRRLFTNNPSRSLSGYTVRKSMWSHIVFEHPARFDTLAMDPERKQEIIDDLVAFRDGKEYYAEVGKVWKRGYLLYGPPGTGKSTMIAAIANFMDYDIYDLELTAVKNNTDLRKLFIETTGKSIIVVEDIDCSLDLTGNRKDKEKKGGKEGAKEEEEKEKKPPAPEDKDDASKITLSGLLNFIDGLWSACGGERIIVFTTNHVEKLDPALIRRGRMDKHIELSYCSFESFKVLARNYVKVDAHHLFDDIRLLLQDVKITPADVAESLMPKSAKMDADTCLQRVVQALKAAKEEAAKAAAEGSKGGEEASEGG